MSKPYPYRILYIENGIGYGGAVICLRHLVRNLDRKMFNPVVVTGRAGSQYQTIASEATWYHFADSIVRLDAVRRFTRQSAFLNRHLFLRGLATQVIARLDDLVNLIPFFIWLAVLLLRVRPSLVHTNNEPQCNRSAIFAAKLFRLPVLCHVRGNPCRSRLTRWIYRLPDHFIPVSYWISDAIRTLGVPERKISVVYDGIPIEPLNPDVEPSGFRTRFGVPENAFAVGLVALLIPWKGQHLFLDAAKLLLPQIPNLALLIVGGTPEECKGYERELKERVIREGLQQAVVFTGHLSTMSPVYRGLDVVVSASTSPEPLGTMVIECMSLARPLVVPDFGGGAEINTHEETALIFDAANPQSLAAAVLRLYREPATRARLGRNARLRVLHTFDITTHARRVEEIYYRLLT